MVSQKRHVDSIIYLQDIVKWGLILHHKEASYNNTRPIIVILKISDYKRHALHVRIRTYTYSDTCATKPLRNLPLKVQLHFLFVLRGNIDNENHLGNESARLI